MNTEKLHALHAEQLKTLMSARHVYDRAMVMLSAAPVGPQRDTVSELLHAIGDVVNLAQSCAYQTGEAARQSPPSIEKST